MKRISLSCLALIILATGVQAACFADYKAKRDNPLRLQYGVARIEGDCNAGAAASELAPRLAAAGWQLLDLVGTFDESGLEERRASAGENYLRY